jgi:hypothetical protein
VWGQETFLVLGASQVGDSQTVPTLEMAIQDALRKAIRDRVRELISPQMEALHHDVLEEELYSRADRYILSYRVLEKDAQAEGYLALLEIVMDTQAVRAELETLGVLTREHGMSPVQQITVVVTGVDTYATYRAIESALAGNDDVERQVTIAELEPMQMTWNVRTTETTEDLTRRVQGLQLDEFVVQVIDVEPGLIHVDLRTATRQPRGDIQ